MTLMLVQPSPCSAEEGEPASRAALKSWRPSSPDDHPYQASQSVLAASHDNDQTQIPPSSAKITIINKISLFPLVPKI